MIRYLNSLLLFFMIFSALPVYGQENTETKGDERTIKQILNDYEKAFNNHDAKAMASYWAQDGDLISPWGELATSRNDVEKLFLDDFKGKLKNAEVKESIEFIRFIKPDIALVDIDRVVANMIDEDGHKINPFLSHGLYVMIKKDNKWSIIAYRSYILLGPIKSV